MISAVNNVCKSLTIFWIVLQYITIFGYCQSRDKWNLQGKPDDGYYLAVSIGEPRQKFNLLIDTGSSNLAIAGANYPNLESFYLPNESQTFRKNGTTVKVMYTQGWWEGFMGQDFVKISSLDYVEPVLTDLAIITRTHGFYVNNSDWQGILGLAYSVIAKPEGSVTSWFDSLSELRPNITNHRFDMELCGPQLHNRGKHVGRFSIGDLRNACPKSDHFTSIERRWYYEVLITDIKVGDYLIPMPCSDYNTPKTLVDSGTSNLQLSIRSYDTVIFELRRQTEEVLPPLSDEFWSGKKEICFSDFENPHWMDFLPPLTIFLRLNHDSHFGLRLPPNSYLRPALNRTDKQCWLLGIEKSQIGTVLGTVAMEGFCLAFHRQEDRIYFSKSECGPDVSLTPIQRIRDPSTPCKYTVHVMTGPLIASSLILVAVLLPLLVAFLRWLYVEVLRPRRSPANVPFISLDETNT